MSAMTSNVQITPGDLGSVPRSVATIVCELVNKHNVRYRMQNNGGHIYLYNGDTQTRPYKISASRPAETTLDFLHKWIKQNVPDFGEDDRPAKEEAVVTPATIAALAEKVNTEPKVVRPAPAPTEEWEDAGHGFVTNGETYRCAHRGCNYVRSDGRGLHFHHASHTGDSRTNALKAAETRALNTQQRESLLFAAMSTIAEQFDMVVVEGGRDVNVEKVLAENEALKKEVGDLKARIELITSALKA